MKFKIQIVLDDSDGNTQIEDVIQLAKNNDQGYCAGLLLHEAKQLLKNIQQKIVLHQARNYTDSHRACPCCHKQRRIKGYCPLQFKTLFGIVMIPSLRLYQCQCSDKPMRRSTSYNPGYLNILALNYSILKQSGLPICHSIKCLNY